MYSSVKYTHTHILSLMVGEEGLLPSLETRQPVLSPWSKQQERRDERNQNDSENYIKHCITWMRLWTELRGRWTSEV